ncbi:lipoprotein [Kribbella albertanoniae]|uniref:ABC transporter n=1 Tax=Kribbella albertanoniae TaxID=1266829 RepID=A0A4R4P4Z0_9ACTN|nr:hypothetical protein [Kribbella albertanoniae]TDC17458.1 hypothetical protein E1261_37045 [Kribbella albertanoniae]
MRLKTISVVLTAVLLATGCQRGSDAKAEAPHGYVEGAEETAEQQSRLVLADAGTGAVQILDLITEKVSPAGKVGNVRELATDGRFAFLGSDTGAHVVDSGAWMVDHGDHVHYYRAKIRTAGDIQGKRPRHIHSDPAITAVSFQDGSVRVYDRTKLEAGAVDEGRSLGSGTQPVPVIPYQEHLLVPGTGSRQDVVEVRDRHGAVKASLEQTCPQVRGEAVTRRGVVFGCSDGALLVTAKDGKFTGEKIPYGGPVADRDRPTDFRHRVGSTTLTAKAGSNAVWVLDVTKRSWKRVQTGPVIAVNTAGEGAPLLALTANGVLKGYDVATGKQTAATKPLSGPGRKVGPQAVIEVDTSRAYVNDSAARKVYEIDYNDDLRLARTFPLDFAPSLMVETGR